MTAILAFYSITTFQTPDPYLLNVNGKATVQVSPEGIYSSQGDKVAAPDIALAARGLHFVYLGESHDNPKHHALQAAVIDALVADGRHVVVGFEMFTRPVQSALNPWTLGKWSEEQFIREADWSKQWGFDYGLYRPIFESTRKYRLPMVALNVPRDWVRTASRQGFDALPVEQRKELPELFMGNSNHRQVFDALVGGHQGMASDKMYTGQVLWDEGMADTALKYLAGRSGSEKLVFVVVAGSGHVMYNQGINYRIERRTGQKGITVVMLESEAPRKVSKGLGDFVYVTLPVPRTNPNKSEPSRSGRQGGR